ncbi:hypothetical protein C9I92_15160 [Photobacterium ganghwense]|uniref:Uncharacterized protein n=1 Tax=Photobacterium ganghwense TaxID=320778 RepID=A0A0J1H8H4_9GAMM|nr:hypothetical protein [Photobacterium ganghwense]KLV07984.1 hypothetical protein ABT57_14145 [Photobacterium ganghwense]PSU07091.1 hypothetical protein C9I92_15160 [Photobacterium ganghwense]QSV15847.1 hypothetical protein FH974_21580 [Photobacterium ganghwense]
MCFDGLGLKVLRQQIRENAERAASQDHEKADVQAKVYTAHKTTQSDFVLDPLAPTEEAEG